MQPVVSHYHTYFLFPFSLDKDAVRMDHADVWQKHPLWIDGLDEWINVHGQHGPVPRVLGRWTRSAYQDFGLESRAYQDMVFFHPFVRRVFFDTTGMMGDDCTEPESLLRFYELPIPAGTHLHLEASDGRGREHSAEVTGLKMFLFANGIGILSVGVEKSDVPASDALWMNEMLRKVYPSSGRQLREGRMPCRLALRVERAGSSGLLSEETWQKPTISSYLPPLSRLVKDLLYFANYDRQEYEPVLDERMIVYSFLTLDPASLPPDYIDSDDYQIFLSRALYVDRASKTFRYDPHFTREQMKQDLYTRWAHQGTYYGFTAYSNITVAVGAFDCDDHLLNEGFLIHRMFETRYYLMAIIGLFYRATLLDFNERAALISKRLYRDYHDDRQFREENIDAANGLLVEFLHFANYWHFDELANKDEEQEHFVLQCRAYRIAPALAEVEDSVRRLNASLNDYYESRQMEAVNRLAILSLVFGGGAVVTGFFGMNFGAAFRGIFFEPTGSAHWAHWAAIAFVALMTLGAFSYGIFLIATHWADYREVILPRRKRPLEAPSVKRQN
jgi:hypothetical protein